MPATRSAPLAMLGERVGDGGQALRVGEQRGQVLELDARLREVGHLARHRRDEPRDIVPDVAGHGSVGRSLPSTHRSMFQPAPHRVGLLLTAYIFFEVSRVRC